MTEAKWDQIVAALQALEDAGVSSTVQALLLYGDADLGVKPGALERAIEAAAKRAVLEAAK